MKFDINIKDATLEQFKMLAECLTETEVTVADADVVIQPVVEATVEPVKVKRTRKAKAQPVLPVTDGEPVDSFVPQAVEIEPIVEVVDAVETPTEPIYTDEQVYAQIVETIKGRTQPDHPKRLAPDSLRGILTDVNSAFGTSFQNFMEIQGNRPVLDFVMEKLNA